MPSRIKDPEKSTAIYRPLPENDSESDSEHGSQSRMTYQPQNPSNSYQRYQLAFYFLFILYILTISVFLVLWRSTSRSHSQSSAEVPYDQATIFNPVREFQVPEAGVTPWEKLLPPGRGFIEILVEIETSNGKKVTEPKDFCISMFHQLHCLASLKVAFSAMSNGTTSMHDHPPEHLGHCFDYLRQAVMCAGDMSLEPAALYKDTGIKGVDGWHTAHQCRNYQKVYDYAAQHRYLNSSGVL